MRHHDAASGSTPAMRHPPTPSVGYSPSDPARRTATLERRRNQRLEERRADRRLRERGAGHRPSGADAPESTPPRRHESVAEFGFEGHRSASSTASTGEEFKGYGSSSSSVRERSSSDVGGGGEGEFGFEGSGSSSGSEDSESSEFGP